MEELWKLTNFWLICDRKDSQWTVSLVGILWLLQVIPVLIKCCYFTTHYKLKPHPTQTPTIYDSEKSTITIQHKRTIQSRSREQWSQGSTWCLQSRSQSWRILLHAYASEVEQNKNNRKKNTEIELAALGNHPFVKQKVVTPHRWRDHFCLWVAWPLVSGWSDHFCLWVVWPVLSLGGVTTFVAYWDMHCHY